jgi:hypothetical protein
MNKLIDFEVLEPEKGGEGRLYELLSNLAVRYLLLDDYSKAKEVYKRMFLPQTQNDNLGFSEDREKVRVDIHNAISVSVEFKEWEMVVRYIDLAFRVRIEDPSVSDPSSFFPLLVLVPF